MGPIHGRLQEKYRREQWRGFFYGMGALCIVAAIALAVFSPR